LLDLLEKSDKGGRVIFNVTQGGEIFWEDMQMKENWSYENGIHQAMVAKRMFCDRLHNFYRKIEGPRVSFIGFEIAKTVWTNQINIIPLPMKIMANVMKVFGTFISIEECGKIMSPLFTENREESLKKSGKFLTWKKNQFIEIEQGNDVLDKRMQDRLWKISLDLCQDEKTMQIAERFV
jgi:hypothetical protein